MPMVRADNEWRGAFVVRRLRLGVRLEQQADALVGADAAGHVQRSLAMSDAPSADGSSPFQQERDAMLASKAASSVQRRVTYPIRKNIDCRTVLEQ
mmetsp:Transcript_29486/g.71663  ORF Transcript_29486/g.71663 Transcript_29486/m.71663 type:complete len:96 (-) Transcript_29486:72-359(-)